ncbi:MAG: hypothetical protein RG740_03300, partial [Acholeplasmataceae bacterium]|nr:hypothetical protein [Acholeplasmataceae bacterium]
SRFVFREVLVEEEIEEEMVARNAFGAVILPHRTTQQNLVLTATFTSGQFVFEKSFDVVLPLSGYDSYANVQSALITTNNRVHSMIGVVYGTYTDANDNEFYLIVDVDGRTTINQDDEEVALPNAFKRVLIQENTPELEIGDEVYIIGRNTRNGTGRFFSPTMNNVYFVDNVTTAHVLSKGNETHITQTAMFAHEFTSLAEAGNTAKGYEYLVTGQLFKSVEERFLPGATDGDPLYDTDIYFVEFNDRRMEFYGLTEDQITLFDSLDGAFVSIPVFYADYESMFGENLNRAQYIGDGTDIVELDAQEIMDLIVGLFDRVIPEEYVSTQDQSFVLPVGRKWDATNENIEYLDVVWTSNNTELTAFTAAGGVQISAPFEETTITVTALIKVFDYETGTEENPVFIETTLNYEFTLKTNMIHWDDLEVVGFTVADIDWLEGMLLDDEDEYWDTWTYGPPGERRSNQDNIHKIVDGDRTELFAIEVEARSSGWNDYVIIDIEFAQAETINSVLVDSGVTGNDKIRGYELYVWDAVEEEWTMVYSITNVPNNALSYHIASFDDVETTQLRIRITDSDQKFWACCYTVRLSEIQIFKAE